MPKAKLAWDSVDTSEWHLKSDAQLGRELGVDKSVIDYWRKKFNIPNQKEYFLAERRAKFEQGLAWCGTHKDFLPIECFGVYKRGQFGLRSDCFECRKKQRERDADKINQCARERYKQNPEPVRIYNLAYRQKNREKFNVSQRNRTAGFKTHFVEMSGGSCHRCSYSEFISGLEFHHVERSTKSETPVKAINSGDYERAYRELDKCILLCRNCHQSFHASSWKAEFIKRDGLGWKIKK